MKEIILLSLIFAALSFAAKSQKPDSADSLSVDLPGIPHDKLETLHNLPAIPTGMTFDWATQPDVTLCLPGRLPHFEWKSAEVSTRTLNIRYNVWELRGMPAPILPLRVKMPPKLQPFNHVEHTGKSWAPYTSGYTQQYIRTVDDEDK